MLCVEGEAEPKTAGGLNGVAEGARALLEMCFVMSICLNQEPRSAVHGRHSAQRSAPLLCISALLCSTPLTLIARCFAAFMQNDQRGYEYITGDISTD